MESFTRSQGPPVWLRMVCLLGAAGCVWGLYGYLVHVLPVDRGGGVGGAVICVGGLVLDVMVLFTRFSATVSSRGLRLSFLPMYRKTLPLDSIASVGDVRHYSAAECGGVGVRLNGGGRVSLLWAPGEGFPVTMTDGREYRVILPGAGELAERLQLARRQAGRA